MQTNIRRGVVLGFLLAAGAAFAQAPADTAVAEKWESAPAGGTEATELATRCVGMPEAEIKRMVSDAGSNAMVTRRSTERSKPYVVATGRRVICVKPSAKGFPQLPQEVFDKTVTFDGMPPEQTAALRSSLSTQLAQWGVASALVKNDLGNAVHLTYLFTSTSPNRVYYQAAFLKGGEFDESRFQSVFSTSGTWVMTARGQPSEQFKPLFAE